MAQSVVSSSDSARRKRLSPTLAQVCAIDEEPPVKARRLRELAVWYRAFAERSSNPVIWESQLLTAEELEAEADRIEAQQGKLVTSAFRILQRCDHDLCLADRRQSRSEDLSAGSWRRPCAPATSVGRSGGWQE
jgi:hypothetical protein